MLLQRVISGASMGEESSRSVVMTEEYPETAPLTLGIHVGL